MRFLIVTPLLPPESGGPSYYAVSLADALTRAGHQVETIAFREVRRYPSGIRHLMFLYLVLWQARRVDALIVLDTVSVAVPAVIAGWLLGKRVLVRTGGDFVWEAYVERTKEKIKLSEFYNAPRRLTRKERLVAALQKYVVFRLAYRVVFSTSWQRDLWLKPYALLPERTLVIENAFGTSREKPDKSGNPTTFLWVGRELVLKNVDMLKEAFRAVEHEHPEMRLKLLSNASHDEVMRELRDARCFVLPSVSEVSPNLVFEALTQDTPVVCTADTGIRDGAPAGVAFVDTGDREALAKALLEMCDTDTHIRYAQQARANVVVRTYDAIAAEMTNALV